MPPAIGTLRYDEDYSYLQDTNARSRQWWDTFANAPLQPRLSLKANVISGDDDPSDADLQTFNPFPAGKYFGEIPERNGGCFVQPLMISFIVPADNEQLRLPERCRRSTRRSPPRATAAEAREGRPAIFCQCGHQMACRWLTTPENGQMHDLAIGKIH